MPTQPVRSVQRAAQVLKVLAAAPHTDRSLSELARAVAISRSSCQALLLALCAEGLVVRRDPGPRYRLGPQLLGLGRAALDAVRLPDVLDHELPRLRDEFQATAFAGAVHGDNVLITAAHGMPHPYGLTVEPGSAIPFRAPVGPIYAAWAPEDVQTRWLDRADPPLAPPQRATLTTALHHIRTRGWSATLDPDHPREATPADLTAPALHIIGISAPVWSPHATFTSSLALTALPTPLTGQDLHHLTHHLTQTATTITQKSGGQAPPTPGS